MNQKSSSYIVVMRHGEAGYATRDCDRRLTYRGVEQCQATAYFLKQFGFEKFDKVITSTYTRTKETADVILKTLNADDREEDKMITPYGDGEMFIDYLRYSKEISKNILIVSHIPTVYDLLSSLNIKNVNFSPATCVVIKSDISNPNVVTFSYLDSFSPK
ncbi:MAG: phosphohistidine phosphatase SixA [Succinivibrionaceae bacterium]